MLWLSTDSHILYTVYIYGYPHVSLYLLKTSTGAIPEAFLPTHPVQVSIMSCTAVQLYKCTTAMQAGRCYVIVAITVTVEDTVLHL